jgi:hypothetical protein
MTPPPHTNPSPPITDWTNNSYENNKNLTKFFIGVMIIIPSLCGIIHHETRYGKIEKYVFVVVFKPTRNYRGLKINHNKIL